MTQFPAEQLRSSFLACALIAPAVAQAQWSELLTPGPASRFGHDMVGEGATGNMLLFGGLVLPSSYSQELWRFDGAAWSLLATSGPAGRFRPALAYDSVRGRLVMFGGVTGSSQFLADCWEWGGTSWIDRSAPGPVARIGHAMAFDRLRGRCVLFGGTRSDDALLGDTWDWDGANWIPRFTFSAPDRRQGHRMVFDAHRGVTVMHGGRTASGVVGDTWEFDGSNWQLRATSSPRMNFQMTYDENWQRTVLNGGESPSGTSLGDVRVWNGQFWAPLGTLAMELECSFGALAFDPVRRRMVHFGGVRSGSGPVAETWVLDGNAAEQFTLGIGCGSPPLTLTESLPGRPVIGQTAELDITFAPLGIAFLTIGTRLDWFGGFPLPVLLDGFGMPGCSIQHSTDLYSAWFAPSVGATTARASVAIPNDLAYLGVPLYLQAWAPAPGANAGALLVSNSLRWRFGDH